MPESVTCDWYTDFSHAPTPGYSEYTPDHFTRRMQA